MSYSYQMSDYDGATPYEFLTGFIKHRDEMEYPEFYVELSEDDNIEGLEGSNLASLMKILYNAGYITASSIEYPQYFLKVYLHHVDGANSEWKIVPMSFYEGVYYDLISHLENPELDSDILEPEVAEEMAREGTIYYLLDKTWTNGEIQDLLYWIVREGKVISPDNDSEWTELSMPRYKKSGRN